MSVRPECLLRPLHKKNRWTVDEDECLRIAIAAFGTDSWTAISNLVPSRSGKQCRERWLGQLAPSVSRDSWTSDEDVTLAQQHTFIGNQWTVIAAQLPGRSALQVKNRWNWLKRHPGPSREPPAVGSPDVVEKRPGQIVFEPIARDDPLFGTRFQEFQAKMFLK
jgi:hypothetical protein